MSNSMQELRDFCVVIEAIKSLDHLVNDELYRQIVSNMIEALAIKRTEGDVE